MAKVHEIRVGSKSFHCYNDGDVKYIAFPEFVDVCGLKSIPRSTMSRRKDKFVKQKQICPKEMLDVFKRMHNVNPKAKAIAVISVQQAVELMRLNDVDNGTDDEEDGDELDQLHSFWTTDFNRLRPGRSSANSTTLSCMRSVRSKCHYYACQYVYA